jgi:hypothetical protein
MLKDPLLIKINIFNKDLEKYIESSLVNNYISHLYHWYKDIKLNEYQITQIINICKNEINIRDKVLLENLL